MTAWVKRARDELKACGVSEAVGFRPPAGVRTPELIWALRDLREPLVLWNRRCFDTVLTFTAARALSLAERLEPGDIVLLHDRQPARRRTAFLEGITALLEASDARGQKKSALTRWRIESLEANLAASS